MTPNVYVDALDNSVLTCGIVIGVFARLKHSSQRLSNNHLITKEGI